MKVFKKQIIALISGLVLSIATVNYVSAATPVTIVLDGITAPYTNSLPYVNNGSTMVPIRFVSENLGAKVSWNNVTKTVGITKEGNNIVLTVGSSFASVNNNRTDVGAKTLQKNGTVMVPLRFVSEILKADVNWSAEDLTVNIVTPGKNLGKLNPTGRKIRTTNLPKNASDYPYILADVPNAMYEKAFDYIGSKGKTTDLMRNETYTHKWENNTEQYYKLLLNVDYRTMNDTWVKDVYSHLPNWNATALTELKEYAAWVKKNKIITEGDLRAEPSMIISNRGYNIRSYYTFKVISANQKKDILYDPYFMRISNMSSFTFGQRYEGYADIPLSTLTVDGSWMDVSLNASLFAANDLSFWKVND